MTTHRQSNDEQERITLDLIRKCVNERGYPPSQQEIATAVGAAAKSTGNRVIARLIAKGLIDKAPGTSRGITVRMVADTEVV